MRLVLGRSMARHARRPNGAGMTVTSMSSTLNRETVSTPNRETVASGSEAVEAPKSEIVSAPSPSTDSENGGRWFRKVIMWLYSSDNPQVRAYYEQDPETGGGKQPFSVDAVLRSPGDPKLPQLQIRRDARGRNLVV